jgi:hypothetical protein
LQAGFPQPPSLDPDRRSIVSATQYGMSSGLDLVVQAVVGFGAAGVGAGATLWATRRQIEATAAISAGERRADRAEAAAQREADKVAAKAERDAERRERELSETQDMLVAAREELTTNIRLGRSPESGHAWAPLSSEFLHRLLLSGRVRDGDRIVKLADAYLAVAHYNAGATLANATPTPGIGAAASGLKEMALAAVSAMEAAVPAAKSLLDALDDQIRALDGEPTSE